MSTLIHVGLVKAASTFIQVAAAQRGDVNIIGWADGCEEVVRGATARAYDQTAATISPHKSIVSAGNTFVSCEEFSGWSARPVSIEQVRAYQACVAGMLAERLPEAKILLVTRDPFAFYDSFYSQLVKQGSADLPRKFVGHWAGLMLAMTDYGYLKTLYSRCFGHGRVLLLPMELLARDPSRFYGELERHCGFVLRPRSPEAIPRNPRLSPLQTEAIRRCNYAIESMSKSAPNALPPYDLASINAYKRTLLGQYIEAIPQAGIVQDRWLARLGLRPAASSVSDLMKARYGDIVRLGCGQGFAF